MMNQKQIPLRFAPPPFSKWVVPHFEKGGLGGERAKGLMLFHNKD